MFDVETTQHNLTFKVFLQSSKWHDVPNQKDNPHPSWVTVMNAGVQEATGIKRREIESFSAGNQGQTADCFRV
jgi:hypothetical protein